MNPYRPPRPVQPPPKAACTDEQKGWAFIAALMVYFAAMMVRRWMI